MADNRSKYINMNRKKSVKKNRNPIRLYILPFYTIIFTTPFKSVQIVAWLSQNHRQATNPAREPHIIWQRPSSLFSLFIVPRALSSSFSQPPCDTKRPLWWRELWSHFIIVGIIYHCCRYCLCNLFIMQGCRCITRGNASMQI